MNLIIPWCLSKKFKNEGVEFLLSAFHCGKKIYTFWWYVIFVSYGEKSRFWQPVSDKWILIPHPDSDSLITYYPTVFHRFVDNLFFFFQQRRRSILFYWVALNSDKSTTIPFKLLAFGLMQEFHHIDFFKASLRGILVLRRDSTCVVCLFFLLLFNLDSVVGIFF